MRYLDFKADRPLLHGYGYVTLDSLVGLEMSATAEAAAECYDAAVDKMLDCSEACASDDEACVAQCARSALGELCTCSEARPATTPAPTPPSPLDLFGKCYYGCVASYYRCKTACESDACVEQCVYDFAVDCNCHCTRHLDSAAGLAGFVRSLLLQRQPSLLPYDLRPQQGRIYNPPGNIAASSTPSHDRYGVVGATNADTPSLRQARSAADAQQAVRCYNAAVNAMLQCVKPCAGARDEARATACVRPAFGAICDCKPRTPRTTSGPPSTPRSTTTTTAPTTPPAGCAALQGRLLLVVAAAGLLARLAST